MSRSPALDERAACRGRAPEMWFALPVKRGTDANPGRPLRSAIAAAKILDAKAKEVCGSCPIAASCVEWAMEREPIGVWGLDQAERAALGGVAPQMVGHRITPEQAVERIYRRFADPGPVLDVVERFVRRHVA